MKPLFKLFFSLCFLLLNGYAIQADPIAVEDAPGSVFEYFAGGDHQELLFSTHQFSVSVPETESNLIFTEENDNESAEPFLLKKQVVQDNGFTSLYSLQSAYFGYCVSTRLPLFQFISYTQPKKCISFQVFRV